MSTYHCHTDAEIRQIREMVRAGKLHRSYLELIEPIPLSPVHSVTSHKHYFTRSTASYAMILILVVTGFAMSGNFSQTAQANVTPQAINTNPIEPEVSLDNERKTLQLLSAIVAQVKTQQARIDLLEANHNESTPSNAEQTSITRSVLEKAYIRSGPSKSFAPLMAVSAGTRLVEIGSNGVWVNVYAPSGETGWISSALLGPFQD